MAGVTMDGVVSYGQTFGGGVSFPTIGGHDPEAHTHWQNKFDSSAILPNEYAVCGNKIDGVGDGFDVGGWCLCWCRCWCWWWWI